MTRQSIRVVFARTTDPPLLDIDCPTFPTLASNMNCPLPGFCAELLQSITQQLNVSIIRIVTRHGESSIGKYANGSWDGTFGYLARGQADTACNLYHDTALRNEHFDFSQSLYSVDSAFAVGRRKDAVANGLWDIVNPYSVETWSAMALVLFVVQLFSICIAKLEVTMRLRVNYSPLEVAWNIIRLQARQIPSFELGSNSGRFVVFTFALMQSQLLLMLYQSWILSVLVSRERPAPFRDADQLLNQLASGEARLVIHNTGNWFYDAVLHSNDSHFVRIREALVNNPIVRTRSMEHSLSVVQQRSNHVVPSELDNLIAQGAELCNVAIVRSGFRQTTARFAFQKGSKFTEMFNEAIAKERLNIRRLYRRYYENSYKLRQQKCDAEREEMRLTKPLQIAPVLGVLLLAAIGYAVSVAIFMVEFASLRYCNIACHSGHY